MHKDPRILPSVPKQDLRNLPGVPMQDSLPDAKCNFGFHYFDETSHCYLVTGNAKTWEEAQKDCNSKGANLVTINSPEENQFVKNLVVIQEREKAWIGMKAALSWFDYSKPDYDHWASGEPNWQATNPCVWMYGDVTPTPIQGFWADDKCELGSAIAIVCKMPPNNWQANLTKSRN